MKKVCSLRGKLYHNPPVMGEIFSSPTLGCTQFPNSPNIFFAVSLIAGTICAETEIVIWTAISVRIKDLPLLRTSLQSNRKKPYESRQLVSWHLPFRPIGRKEKVQCSSCVILRGLIMGMKIYPSREVA